MSSNSCAVAHFPMAARIILLAVILASPGCGGSTSEPSQNSEKLTIEIRSDAFTDGGMIPSEFSCVGSDRSPPLHWSGVPETSRTLALICDDPDAPGGTWSHWVVFNLPARVNGLKEGIPAGETIPQASVETRAKAEAATPAQQGKNDFGNLGYGGPCPPSGTHRYFFRLYAVDTTLELKPSATRADVLTAIKGHVLAEGRLMGKYAREVKN
jgi:Raf kinase inhibitor-like YbhB/YbcL family protein